MTDLTCPECGSTGFVWPELSEAVDAAECERCNPPCTCRPLPWDRDSRCRRHPMTVAPARASFTDRDVNRCARAIHTADLPRSTKPSELRRRIARAVLEEFFQ